MSDVQRILVRAPNWIGDQIMAREFFQRLRAKSPAAEITVACVSWVADLQFRDCVDQVVILEKSTGARKAVLNIQAGLMQRKRGFDLGIALPNSFSTAGFLWSAGCRIRRGYRAEWRDRLLTDPQPWIDKGQYLHRAKAYAFLAQADEVEIAGAPDFEKMWPDVSPFAPPEEPYFVVAPGSTAASRRWPIDRFGAVARHAWKSLGLRPVIVGGRAEATLAEALMGLNSEVPWVNWTGRGSPAALWRLFRNARCSLVNESGLAHLSSLCGSKTFIVVGAADPSRTAPVGPGPCRIVTHQPSCWPCERNDCRNMGADYLKCLDLISVNEVSRLIEQSLEL